MTIYIIIIIGHSQSCWGWLHEFWLRFEFQIHNKGCEEFLLFTAGFPRLDASPLLFPGLGTGNFRFGARLKLWDKKLRKFGDTRREDNLLCAQIKSWWNNLHNLCKLCASWIEEFGHIKLDSIIEQDFKKEKRNVAWRFNKILVVFWLVGRFNNIYCTLASILVPYLFCIFYFFISFVTSN